MSSANSKQLILLLDGTWNDADLSATDTNIVRLRELINRSLGADPFASESKLFARDRSFGPDGVRRLVFYERGVGTGALLDQVYGGAFGKGLGVNVRRAYKFLSWWYEPGDQIFIFGFSRGAYTARSLVGMLASAGLLRRPSCNAQLEQSAWDFYRTPVNDRLAAKWDELTPYVHDREDFKVTCVGVFDTVGALGVPLPVFVRKNREIYGFHDVDLGSITQCNLHALAIDEHREPFQATVWRKPKFKSFDPRMIVEQVWFPGAHGDLGGGYVTEWDRVVRTADGWERRRALDDIALDWMLKRVLAHFPNFPVRLQDQVVDSALQRKVWSPIDDSWALAEQHNSRSGPYLARPFVMRAINNYAGRARPWPRHYPYVLEDEFVGFDRHAEPIGEIIHISALLRYGAEVRIDGAPFPYTPENVKRVAPYVAATYGLAAAVNLKRQILVVDWDGRPLDPGAANDRQRVANLFAGGTVARADLDQRVAEVIRDTPTADD